MVEPKTNAVWFHIAWHEELLAQQKKQEMQAQQQQLMGANPQQGSSQQSAINDSMGAIEKGKPNVSADKKNPLQATSPLKAEIVSNNSNSNNFNK